MPAIMEEVRQFLDAHCDLCQRSRSSVGYLIGWLGVIYRTAAILALSIVIARADQSGSILVVLLSIVLAYCFLSLAANFLLIVGISQIKPKYLFPYRTMIIFEIVCGLIGLIAGTAFFAEMGQTTVLSYFIPGGIAILAIYSYLWWLLNKLHQHLLRLYQERIQDKDEARKDGVLDLFRNYFRPSRQSFNLTA